ncbi:oligosaccharide flippase family protein [Bacillus cereus]|uniref:oligosaccharide flippase family protein n=1 Tax=Bacillus cereus TaxID=1396 RepID=UPI00211D3B7F|nr:oligosaccharide flippase family protein [Bacillus cereus]
MNKILRDSMTMLLSTLFTAGVTFVTDIISRNILGPQQYGLWLTISMVLVYGTIIQFGVLNGMNREIPRLLGKNQIEEAEHIRQVVKGWMCIPFIVSFLLVIFILCLDISANMKAILGTIFLLIPVQQLLGYYRMIFLTIDDFKKISRVQIITTPVQAIFGCIMAYFFGIYGLIAGIYIATILGMYLFKSSIKRKISTKRDWNLIKSLLKFGVPIMLIGFSWTLFTTVDRIMISMFYDSKALGYYGIALMMFQVLMMAPQVFSQVMYPKISFLYGKEGPSEKLVNMINLLPLVIAIFIPYILCIIYYGLPYFVDIVMPQYIQGVEAAQALIFGVYFISLVGTYANFLNSSNNHWKYLKIIITSIFINIIMNYIFIKYGGDITSISIATSISNFCYLLFLSYSTNSILGVPFKLFLRKFSVLILPFIFLLLWINISKTIDGYIVTKVFLFIIVYSLPISYVVFKSNIFKKLNFKFKEKN